MKGIINFFKKLMKKNREHFIVTHTTKNLGYFWAGIKMLFGVFTAAYFLCLSAMYTFAFSISKKVFFAGKNASNGDVEIESKYYLKMCGILTLASVIYIVYMARLFFYPATIKYDMVFGIACAAFAFTDIIIAIINLIRSNRRKDLLVSGVKSIGLASALIAIAFAQVAILSFSMTDSDPSFYNAIIGIVMGCGGLIICIFMLTKYFFVKKQIQVMIQSKQQAVETD